MPEPLDERENPRGWGIGRADGLAARCTIGGAEAHWHGLGAPRAGGITRRRVGITPRAFTASRRGITPAGGQTARRASRCSAESCGAEAAAALPRYPARLPRATLQSPNKRVMVRQKGAPMRTNPWA